MSQFDLISAVQPSSGWFAVVGIKDDPNPAVRVRQWFVETREEVDDIASKFAAQSRNVFFGVAKYASDDGRSKENVSALRSFWLDIDCGLSKAEVNPKTGRAAGYIDQKAGLDALRSFCVATKLPRPILVNSGRGLHVYWAMDRDIQRWEWEPVAASLRTLCGEHGLLVDPAVFEVARILRVPGTLNFKDDPPKPVEVIAGAEPVDFEVFRDLLGVLEAVPPPAPISGPKRELTELGKSLRDNDISVFRKIMARSTNGKGCAQLLDCYQTRDTLAEPRWFDALSIAKFCEDADVSIHKLSEGHPDYDPDRVINKIQHIKGPHGCATFERNNPGGCDKCPHRGKITSPIMLGKDIRVASRADNVIEQDDDTYVIPKFPEPYFRGANGGIYIRGKDEESEPLLIYERDVYVVKRMHDPELRDVVIIRAHMPQDGVKEFMVPNTSMASPDELKKALAGEGVLTYGKRSEMLAAFIITCTSKLQDQRKAELMRLQFGWADNDTKFIVGDREITVDGVFHSPPSTTTAPIAQHIGPVGTLEAWKEVWALYGRPGMEPNAFAALTAFSAPLFKFFGQKGAILNVIHPSSGTGKTTILRMANSIWGHPENMNATKSDTMNALINKIGVFNNICICVDEITNMKPEVFSELIYGITQGRGKDRMEGSTNKLRHNATSWCTEALCSSNASFAQKLGSYKNAPDGELMRLMEYSIDYSDAIETQLAKQMFDHQLMHNYGHAGPIFIDYAIKNYAEVIETCVAIQKKLDFELGLTQRERFWSAGCASRITAGLVCVKIGLIDWDMARMYRFAAELIGTLRKDSKPPLADAAASIGDFINVHMSNILVVNDGVDSRSGKATLPQMEPRGELMIRYEPDTKRMYIAVKPLRNYCVETQTDYKETLKQLEEKGILIGNTVKRLSKGSKVNSPGVYALILDCSASDFLDVDAFVGINPEQEVPVDGGGEGQL